MVIQRCQFAQQNTWILDMNLVFLENVSMCEIFGIKFSVSHRFLLSWWFRTSQQGQGVKVGRWSRSSDQGGKSRRCKQRKCQISTIFSGGITITKRSIKPFEGTTPFSFRGAQHLNLIRSLKWNSIQFVSFFLRVWKKLGTGHLVEWHTNGWCLLLKTFGLTSWL